MHVTGVRIADAVLHGDVSCPRESLRRCVRFVEHAKVGMKGGEVHRDVGAEVFDDPLCHLLKFLVRVVFTGNEQRRKFEPDVRFLLEINQRIENGLQIARANLPVESLGECLEIDVGGIDDVEKFQPRFRANFAGGDRHRFHTDFVTGVCHVDGVLHKNHGVIVGERDTLAAELAGRFGDRFRWCLVGQRVDLAGFADVPVLTKLAAEIATRRSERQDRCPRIEVVERLLFDGVDAVSTRPAVGRENNLVVFASTDKTKTALPFVQLAESRAEITLNAPVFQLVPVLGRYGGVNHGFGPLVGGSDMVGAIGDFPLAGSKSALTTGNSRG